MNPARLKLVLAALWFAPAAGLLAAEAWQGRVLAALPVGGARLPLSWLFLSFAAFNLLRWWAGRSTRASGERWRAFRERPRRRDAGADPDPDQQFDDPPR